MPVRDDSAGGVVLEVWVQPRAARTEAAGVRDGAVRIRVAAPPADGKANQELVRFLAQKLGVPRRAIEILKGHTGRRKILRVQGTDPGTVRRVLGVA